MKPVAKLPLFERRSELLATVPSSTSVAHRRIRVLLLGAPPDADNRGLGALVSGALHVILHRYPDAEISLLDYGRTHRRYRVEIEGRVLDVPLVNLRFSRNLLLPNHVATLLVVSLLSRTLGPSLGAHLVRTNSWLTTVAEADIVCCLSGGDSFSDIYGLRRFLYVLLPQLVVACLRRPLILLPQTIGPFSHRASAIVARFILRRARRVYARDPAAAADILRLVGESDERRRKVRFCFDLGFLLTPRRPLQAEPRVVERTGDRLLVGLNVSGLLTMGGYDGRNMFRLGIDYNVLIDRIIEFLIFGKGADVLLLPHVFGHQEENDVTPCRTLYAHWKAKCPDRVFYSDMPYDHSEIKYMIGTCDLFIGSRMHACIAALSQSIPVLAIAYSSKFRGVFASVGAGAMVADPRRMDLSEILAMIDSLFAGRDEMTQQLAASMPYVRDSLFNVLEEIDV